MAAEVIPQADSSGPSEGARLRARGTTITIAGEPHRLVFSYEAWLALEDEFASLEAFLTELRTQRLKPMISGIAACLLHEYEEATPAQIQVLQRRLLRDLPAGDRGVHYQALSDAIVEGLPAPDKRPAGPKVRGSGVSHGGGSTTSRSSASVSRTPNFGGQRRRSSRRS